MSDAINSSKSGNSALSLHAKPVEEALADERDRPPLQPLTGWHVLASNRDVMALRDVLDSDLPIFFEHQCDPEANRMAAFAPRERDAFMVHWRTKVLGNSNNKKKTIVVDGEVAGNIGSWEQDGKRCVGYWLGRAYWGRGIATAALSEFIAEYETTRPLQAFVVAHNIGSIRVLEKSGFRRAGDASIGHDGVEELLMELRRSD